MCVGRVKQTREASRYPNPEQLLEISQVDVTSVAGENTGEHISAPLDRSGRQAGRQEGRQTARWAGRQVDTQGGRLAGRWVGSETGRQKDREASTGGQAGR